MEGSNGLISEFPLFLDMGEGFRGVGVRRGGTRRKGELRGEFFLTESDGFRLGKMRFSTKIRYMAQTPSDLVLPLLGFRWCEFPRIFLLLCPVT